MCWGGEGAITKRTGKPNLEAAKRLRTHSLHTMHTTACSAVVVAARSKHPRFSEGPVFNGSVSFNTLQRVISLPPTIPAFGSPFSSERLWLSVDTVLRLCPSLPTQTLKWLSSRPI